MKFEGGRRKDEPKDKAIAKADIGGQMPDTGERRAESAGGGLACYKRATYFLDMGADRITRDPKVMGGKPCIRGMRITAGTISGLVTSGHSADEVLRMYPFLDEEDIQAALAEADADIAAGRLLSPGEVRRGLGLNED
jgi:uncharacterized protein (DUF433 family)